MEAVQDGESALSWSVHLRARQPLRTTLIGLILAMVFALGLCVFHSFWLGLLPMLAVLFSLSEFIFPVHYTLTAQSASAKHGLTSLEIRWADVRHAYLTEEGIKLSPLTAKNSRFEFCAASSSVLMIRTKKRSSQQCASCGRKRKLFMSNLFGLIDFDWDAPVSEDERDRVFDKIVGAVRKWRLEIPATLFLESSAPLSHIAGQSLVAFSPFVAPLLPDGIHGVQRLQKILEHPQNVRILIDRICEPLEREP